MDRNLHLLVHVPKCAGRSIEDHFQKHLGPQRFWRPGKRTNLVPLELLGRKYDARPPGRLEDVEAISGHLFGRSIEKLFPDRMMVRSVILREPEKQMLSWYNYRMMRYLSEGLHPFPFRLFVRAFPVDPVAHFLLERWLELPWTTYAMMTAQQKVALLDDALSHFDRVVDIAEASDLCAWHSRDLGIPEDADRTNTSDQWSDRTGWQPLKLSELSEQDLSLLQSRFLIDRYLWRRWALKQNVSFERSMAQVLLPSEPMRAFYELRLRMARETGW